MHVYFPVLDFADAYVVPAMDAGVVRANAFVLAQDLDATSPSVLTERPPLGLLNGGHLLIGDEQLDFGWVSWRKPPGFHGVVRGSHGTRATSHKAGTIVYLLGTYAGKLQLDPHSDLNAKVCDNVARFVNTFDLDLLFFDANEGPLQLQGQSQAPTAWYDRTAWHRPIWSALRRPDIIVESSDIQHYDWHLNTRSYCGDPDVSRPQADDPAYKKRTPHAYGYEDLRDNLMPPNLGWSLIHGEGPGMMGLSKTVPPTTVRDIEIHLDVARELDCPSSFEITPEDWKTNKDIGKILALLKRHETARLNR